jgi:hypothetical protein
MSPFCPFISTQQTKVSCNQNCALFLAWKGSATCALNLNVLMVQELLIKLDKLDEKLDMIYRRIPQHASSHE